MNNYYDQCIHKCLDTENSRNKIKNLKRELNEFLMNPDFRSIDIYKKHSEYCFTRGEPMSGLEIKNIRKEIKRATGLKIEYENPIFQLLKRGIGLYISSMPDEYNWILQRLMSEKKLGIIISDRTLCLGIDLPIRSVSFSGYKNPKYTKSDYLQMSGRAGRRGHDNQGNIIFHNVKNYIELMKGNLPKLEGSNKELGDSYSLINDMNNNISLKNMKWRIDGGINKLKKNNLSIKFYKLGWYLRYYKKSLEFIHKLNTIEKKIFMICEDDREYWLFNYIVNELFEIDTELYLMIYKKNKIDNNKNEILKNLIKIGDVIKDIVNTLDNSYMITKENGGIIFEKLRILIYKYRGFE